MTCNAKQSELFSASSIRRWLGLCLFLGLVACNSGGGGGSKGKDKSSTEGQLLVGADDDPALGATRKLRSAPAKLEDIDERGWVRTRLEAVLHSHATVGQVNEILDSVGAKIVHMNEEQPFVNLAVNPQPNLGAARKLAHRLAKSEAFSLVFPASTPKVSTLPDDVDSNPIQAPWYLDILRMPAAWNVAGDFTLAPGKVPVLVADSFYCDEGHEQLGAMRFPEGETLHLSRFDGAETPEEQELQHELAERGNHGYNVAGIIGADFDGVEPTGISPDPRRLLDLLALPLSELDWEPTMDYIVDHFPESESQKFIVNMSFGYRGFDTVSKLQRATHAIKWRWKIAPYENQLFYAAAAGNEGEDESDLGSARFQSPFCAALLWDDLREIVEGQELTSEEREDLDDLWTQLIHFFPEQATANCCGLVVGNTDGEDDGPVSSSSRDWQVLCVGEDINCASVYDRNSPKDSCDDLSEIGSGTSFAAPQVAGLAAYLWNLDPDLFPWEIQEVILESRSTSFDGNSVDAYAAVLALDPAIYDAPIRHSLLDVATDQPDQIGQNGIFDENDLEAFLTVFGTNDQPEGFDYSRYDLNGDTITGWVSIAPFDLDCDRVLESSAGLEIEGNLVSFNENGVTDTEILCYYAYSELYQGSVARRAELLEEYCGGDGDDGDGGDSGNDNPREWPSSWHGHWYGDIITTYCDEIEWGREQRYGSLCPGQPFGSDELPIPIEAHFWAAVENNDDVADADYTAWVTDTEFRIETVVVYDKSQFGVPNTVAEDTWTGKLENGQFFWTMESIYEGQCEFSFYAVFQYDGPCTE